MKRNSFHLVSLGCAKNTVDSNTLGNILVDAGYEFTDNPKQAEILIVNTCGFIKPAREEAVSILNELAKSKKKNQYLIAAGCMAETFSEEILERCPGVDRVLGTRSLTKVLETINDVKGKNGPHHALPQYNLDEMGQYSIEGSSAYLKIADGCSRRCAFCAIPGIKGEWHSRPVDEILADAAELNDAGIQELIIIAQDTTAYGIDRGEKDALPELLEKIMETAPDIPWIRIMYAFPGFVSDRLIDLMAADNRILPYLDIPLQHADPAMLKRMRRPDDMQWVRNTLTKMRERIPGMTIRSTFITGFPGETEEEFTSLYRFIESMNFDRVGVFPYYPEVGTPSYDMEDDVPFEVKEERHNMIMELQQEISHDINTKLIGKTLDVLIEGVRDDMPVGRSYRDAPEIDGLVYVNGAVPVGAIVPVEITGVIGDYDLIGKSLIDFEEDN